MAKHLWAMELDEDLPIVHCLQAIMLAPALRQGCCYLIPAARVHSRGMVMDTPCSPCSTLVSGL